jgi:hypothetical protein
VPPITQIFDRKSWTHRTLGSHQIQGFRHRLEKLVGREANGKLKEASAHVLGTRAPLGEDLIAVEARLSCTNVADPLWTNLITASE